MIFIKARVDRMNAGLVISAAALNQVFAVMVFTALGGNERSRAISAKKLAKVL